jgi:antitoxin HicB
MLYPCKLEPNGEGGFIVTFPNVPEALTEGANREEALINAADAIEVALLGRMKDGDEIPLASGVAHGTTVYVPAHSAAKLAFYVAFRESGLTRSALAKKIGKDEAEVRRMLDPYHGTKLPPLEEALLALGKRLVIDVRAA